MTGPGHRASPGRSTSASSAADGDWVAVAPSPSTPSCSGCGRSSPGRCRRRGSRDGHYCSAGCRGRERRFDQLLHRAPVVVATTSGRSRPAGYLLDGRRRHVRPPLRRTPARAVARSGRSTSAAAPGRRRAPARDDARRAVGQSLRGRPGLRPRRRADLQARWLRNSLAGRADHVLIGVVDGRRPATSPAGSSRSTASGSARSTWSAPCRPSEGVGVAATIVDHSLAWFSDAAALVTVRTQATNIIAAGVYERAGMTLRHSD